MTDEPLYKDLIVLVARTIELAGLAAMVMGIIFASFQYFSNAIKKHTLGDDYEEYRINIGRSILLSLELLVGADIVMTIAMKPTLENATILGVIVVIRTVLSTALQMEIKGHFPWDEAKYKIASRAVSSKN